MVDYVLIGLGIFIASFLGGACISYWWCEDAIKQAQEYDKATEQANVELQQQKEELNQQVQDLVNNIQNLTDTITNLNNKEQQQKVKLDVLKDSIQFAEEQAKDASEKFYKSNMELAQLRFEQDIERAAIEHQKAIEDFEISLRQMQEENTTQFAADMAANLEAFNEAQQILVDLQNKVNSAIEASKRAEEMRTAQEFYKIQLSDIDIEEIEKLRAVEPYLRDKEPLNKVIWKVYYENPTNDLIGRVIGSGPHTGIYKITHIESQKCYVGQAANLADRWKQHIKRGVGADAPTRNKLYPAMRKYGPENFTFEVIEECNRALLDSREDYWQEFYHARDYGFSIK